MRGRTTEHLSSACAVVEPTAQPVARQVADRVVFLHEGAVAEQGTPEAVLDDPRHPALRTFLERVRR